MACRIVPLGSGSRGNATLVELDATRLLIDAGFSAKALARRLASIGVEASRIDFILLSHEHHDHARGAQRFSVLHQVPVVCTRATLEALDLSRVHLAGWQELVPGEPLTLRRARIDAFPIPHDAADPVGFVVRGDGIRFGAVTDIGHATTLVVERLRGCDGLLIEANHDDAMLRDGPYPWQLKQRVGGRMGHLSNDEAAELIARVADDRCQGVLLGHLSEKNNTPQMALDAVARVLGRDRESGIEVRVAASGGPSAPLVLRSGPPRQRRARQTGLFPSAAEPRMEETR